MKRLRTSLILLLLSIGAPILSLLSPATASAAFNQNNIISDNVFSNSGSMSAAQIDAFLNSFPSSCISTNRGFSSPSLNGYNPSQGFLYGGNVSAGNVIATAAQVYGVNPQVILSTLQKEQSLVSGSAGCHYDTPPTLNPCPDPPYGTSSTCVTACQYSGGCVYIAMGYDCPYYCMPNSTGFSKQIIKATWKLKFVQQRSLGNYNWNVQLPGWDNSDDPQTAYDGYMTQGYLKRNSWSAATNYDGYRPVNSNSLTVHLDSGATASLYSFTPFTSGNTNFVNIFEGWFGSTQGNGYSWQFMGQAAYTDETKTTAKSTQNMLPGDRVFVSFLAKNTGTTTWQRGGATPIKAGTVNPLDRQSAFCDSWAYGCNRPAALKEDSVAPGQVGTFEFWMKAPNNAGSYNERFNLVVDGVTWLADQGVGFSMSVSQPTYSWQFMGQAAYTDDTKASAKSTQNMLPGDRVFVSFLAKNTGNVTWTNGGANPINVGMTQPIDRSSPFYDASWLGTNRPAKLKESSVAPGQVGTFEFWMKAPNQYGSFRENYSLVAEGRAWMNDPGMNFFMSVSQPTYTWQFMGQAAFADETKTTGKSTVGLARGDRVYVSFLAKNTGNVTWTNTGANPINVGMTRPLDRASPFYDASWLGTNRPTRMLESSIAPGQVGTFEFWMHAPNYAGSFREYYSLVAEGRAWMNDPAMNFYMTVN